MITITYEGLQEGRSVARTERSPPTSMARVRLQPDAMSFEGFPRVLRFSSLLRKPTLPNPIQPG